MKGGRIYESIGVKLLKQQSNRENRQGTSGRGKGKEKVVVEEEEVVVVEEGDCCTVTARMVQRRKRKRKGSSLKIIVLIPTYALQVPTYPPFLRSVMSHTTSKKTPTLAAL